MAKAIGLVSREVTGQDAKERFFQSLQNHFGVRSETRNRTRVDTLRLPFNRPLLNLDPAHVYRRTEAHMVQQAMDTLVRYDINTQSIAPHLAHHWEAESEGSVWTFYLRKGVLFHHGREMTASDVKHTFERLLDPQIGSGYRSLFADLSRITVLSDTAIRFEFGGPNYLFIHYLCLPCASIVPIEKTREPEFPRLPVGTGPWKITHNDEKMLTFESFDRYCFGRPYLDRVEVLIVPERERSGALGDWAGKEVVFYPFQPKPENRNEWLHLERIESGVYYLAFNLARKGPLQDPVLREAIDAGIDRKRMVRELGDGKVEAFGFVYGGKQEERRVADIERAKEMVAASAYRGEVLRMFVYEGAGNERNAEWLCRRMAEFGVNAEVVVWKPDELNRPEKQLEADLICAGYVYDDDLLLSLTEIFENSKSYILNLLHPEVRHYVTGRIAALKREPDMNVRMVMHQEIEAKLKKERALLFLFHAGQSIVFHPSLQGVQLNVRGWVDYKELWVKK